MNRIERCGDPVSDMTGIAFAIFALTSLIYATKLNGLEAVICFVLVFLCGLISMVFMRVIKV